MVALPCLAVGFLMNLVAVLFVLVSLALILVVLIQKGRGGGLSAAFGGGGAGGVLGTKTGDFLTWVTIGLVSAFLILAVLMARYYKPNYDTGDGAPQGQSAPAEQAGNTETPTATDDATDQTPTEDEINAAAAEALADVNNTALPLGD